MGWPLGFLALWLLEVPEHRVLFLLVAARYLELRGIHGRRRPSKLLRSHLHQYAIALCRRLRLLLLIGGERRRRRTFCFPPAAPPAFSHSARMRPSCRHPSASLVPSLCQRCIPLR